MSDVKRTTISDIRKMPDLAISDPHAGLDLFDIQIGRNIDTYDEDLNLFNILCHAYILSGSQLISMHYETSNNDLNSIATKLIDNAYYLKVIKYNKDGSIRDSQSFKASFDTISVVVHSDNSIVSKAFIFNIEH